MSWHANSFIWFLWTWEKLRPCTKKSDLLTLRRKDVEERDVKAIMEIYDGVKRAVR